MAVSLRRQISIGLQSCHLLFMVNYSIGWLVTTVVSSHGCLSAA
jgi:hypothetical protein